ncbi:MAG: SLBB domain-containing protein, partial [Planctomycetaceae bacterium]
IGNVQVVGLELQAAEAAIVAACIYRKLFTSPHVTATMKQRRVNRVTVVGAVETPGTFELPRNVSNLLSAVVAAEGLAEDAGEHVYLRVPRQANAAHNQQTAQNGAHSKIQATGHSARLTPAGPSPNSVGMDSQKINLTEVAEAGSQGFPVPDGGVVMVERRDPEPVQVLGLVNNPGTYEFPLGKDVRVLDAIAMAGGMSNGVADKIYVIRNVSGQSNPAVIQLSFEKAKKSSFSNMRLQPTDVVSVEQTMSTIVLDTLKTMNLGVGASLNALF